MSTLVFIRIFIAKYLLNLEKVGIFFNIKHTSLTLHITLNALLQLLRKYVRKLAVLESVIMDVKNDNLLLIVHYIGI